MRSRVVACVYRLLIARSVAIGYFSSLKKPSKQSMYFVSPPKRQFDPISSAILAL
jgi:hypothetical protein